MATKIYYVHIAPGKLTVIEVLNRRVNCMMLWSDLCALAMCDVFCRPIFMNMK